MPRFCVEVLRARDVMRRAGKPSVHGPFRIRGYGKQSWGAVIEYYPPEKDKAVYLSWPITSQAQHVQVSDRRFSGIREMEDDLETRIFLLAHG